MSKYFLERGDQFAGALRGSFRVTKKPIKKPAKTNRVTLTLDGMSLTIRIPVGLHKLVKKLAKLEGRSVNNLITRMIQQGVLTYDIPPKRKPSGAEPPEAEPPEADFWPDFRNPSR